MKEEKVYLIRFNVYTDCTEDSVWKEDKHEVVGDYLSIPFGGLLVRESELEKYRVYGNGFESIKFVGSMFFEE